MKVTVYVEGGGDGKDLRIRCREGFSKLAENAGFAGRMPRFVACGSRDETFRKFRTAVETDDGYPLLLVDSEGPVPTENVTIDSPVCWNHLRFQDNWVRPPGAANDQAQLMATSMETWLMTDREALDTVFGSQLNSTVLFSPPGLEARAKNDVFRRLVSATEPCGQEKTYRKGPVSFAVLARVTADRVRQHLAYFARFIATLNSKLNEAE